jgi:hypothetical protein
MMKFEGTGKESRGGCGFDMRKRLLYLAENPPSLIDDDFTGE